MWHCAYLVKRASCGYRAPLGGTRQVPARYSKSVKCTLFVPLIATIAPHSKQDGLRSERFFLTLFSSPNLSPCDVLDRHTPHST